MMKELISAVKNNVPFNWTLARVSKVERFLSELAIQLEMKIQLTMLIKSVFTVGTTLNTISIEYKNLL